MLTLVASSVAVAEDVAALPSPTCTLPALMLKVVVLMMSLISKLPPPDRLTVPALPLAPELPKPYPPCAFCVNAMAAKLPSSKVVPLVAVVRLRLMSALLAFRPPVTVLVAPPLVLKVFVVLVAPMGLPPKFMVPPPLPPVKLKAVLFHRPSLLPGSVKLDAFSTLTLMGASVAKVAPVDSVRLLPSFTVYALEMLVVAGAVAIHESKVKAPTPALVKLAALMAPS